MAKVTNNVLAQTLAKAFAKALPDDAATVTTSKPGAPRHTIRHPMVAGIVASVFVHTNTAYLLLPSVKLDGVRTQPDRNGTAQVAVKRSKYTNAQLTDLFATYGKKAGAAISYTIVLDPTLKAKVERGLKQGQTFSGLVTELLQNHVAP